MKLFILSLLTISFLLLSGNLSAQLDSSQRVPKKNPRSSRLPAYSPPQTNPTDTIRDTSYKTLKTKESVDEQSGGGLGYFGLVLGITRGQFAANTNNAMAFGFDAGGMMNLASRRKRSEWEERWVNTYIGFHFMYLRYSSATDDYEISNGQYKTEIESKVRSNMFQLGPVCRLEVLPGRIKLFAEVGAGGTFFHGVHRIETTSIPVAIHQPEDEKTSTDSRTLSGNLIGYYNYAFGMRVSGESIGVEFKFTTLYGGLASYIDIESVTFDRNNNSVEFSTHRSTTDLFIPTLAICGRF